MPTGMSSVYDSDPTLRPMDLNVEPSTVARAGTVPSAPESPSARGSNAMRPHASEPIATRTSVRAFDGAVAAEVLALQRRRPSVSISFL